MAHSRPRAASYLSDLLRDIVGAVDELAGRDDVHLSRGEGDERVGLEIYKVEGDLRDLGDGAVPHQVRVRRGVQDVGLAVDRTCRHGRRAEEEVKGLSLSFSPKLKVAIFCTISQRGFCECRKKCYFECGSLRL